MVINTREKNKFINDRQIVYIDLCSDYGLPEIAGNIFSEFSDKDEIFRHYGTVVEIGENAQLKPVNSTRAKSIIERYCHLFRRADRVSLADQRVTLSTELASSILVSDEVKLLKHLKGILRYPMPMLDRTGKLVEPTMGFNSELELFFKEDELEYPESLEDAVRFLRGLFEGFEFNTPSDLSCTIASLITPALKSGGFIKGYTPITIIEADQSRAGKGTLVLFLVHANGEQVAIISQSGDGLKSLDHQFDTAVANGKRFINIDNVRGQVNSASIEAFMTSEDSYTARKLHKAVDVDPSLYSLYMTSNEVDTTPDLANRGLIIQIKKKPADYVYPTIEGVEAGEFIKDNPRRILGAIGRVLIEYYNKGMPRSNSCGHSFREWEQRTDWIVQNFFDLPPIMANQKERIKAVSSLEIRFLQELAEEILGTHREGIELKADEIRDICYRTGIVPPGFTAEEIQNDSCDDNLDKVANRKIGKILKKASLVSEKIALARCSCVIRRSEEKDNKGKNPLVLIIN